MDKPENIQNTIEGGDIETTKQFVNQAVSTAIHLIKNNIYPEAQNIKRHMEAEWEILDIDPKKARENLHTVVESYKSKGISNPTEVEHTQAMISYLQSQFLLGSCLSLSLLIQPVLANLGLNTSVVVADVNGTGKVNTEPNGVSPIHKYLKVNEISGMNVEGLDLIIDFTIGQFIDGCYYVFIGSRQELKALVDQSILEGKIINFNSQGTLFQRAWGDSSIKIYN